MPKINEMLASRYVKKDDVLQPKLLTIRDCIQDNLAHDDQPVEMAWCLKFDEIAKLLILKPTILGQLEAALQSNDSDHWIGRKIVAYNDPSVMYKGKVIGGVRIRAPRGAASAPSGRPIPAAPVPPVSTTAVGEEPDTGTDDNTDIPF